jgi:hypothetical protein
MAFANENITSPTSTTTPINLVEERNKLNQQNDLSEETPSEAEFDDEYKIELLIFAYVNTGEENSEVWRNPSRPDFSNLQLPYESKETLIKNQPTLNALQSTLKDKEALNKETENKYIFLNIEDENVSDFDSIIRKMKINGQYRTLQHLVWQQKVLDEDAQDLFYLKGGGIYITHEINKALNQEQNNTEEINDYSEQSLQKSIEFNQALLYKEESSSKDEPLGEKELEGTIQIYRSRFLHIKTNLWFSEYSENDAGLCLVTDYSEENNEQTTATITSGFSNDGIPLQQHEELTSFTRLTNFQINQHRRLRSSELHYLDHPRFGLLIKFSRIEPETNTEPDT